MSQRAAAGSDRQGLRELTRGVLGEAQAEARQTLADAQARVESIRLRARERSEVRKKEILESARKEADPIRSQGAASAQLEAQRLRLESREQLLDRVFSDAREAFKDAAQQMDYPDMLHRMIRDAVANLGSAAVVLRADARSQRHLTDSYLSDLGEEMAVTIEVGEPLATETGIVVESPNGHRRYRHTLEAQLERIEETLRASVYRLLRGESL
jgi:vacuolar-type H+-ATPase subunit E/Vma4